MLSAKIKTRFRRRIGFTFLEVILTVSLFSVIMLAVVSAFSVGKTAWASGLSQSNKDYKAFFALDEVSGLIRKALLFKEKDFYGQWLEFKGEKENLAFAVLSKITEGDKSVFERVEIKFNGYSKNVTLTRASLKNLVKQTEGKTKNIFSNIEKLSFQYARIKPEAENTEKELEIEWLDKWPRDDKDAGLPLAVRIIIDYLDDKNNPQNITKDVYFAIQNSA